MNFLQTVFDDSKSLKNRNCSPLAVYRILAFSFSLFVLSSLLPAYSVTKTWIGAGTGGGSGTNFNDPAVWSPAGVPGPADDVMMELGSGATIQLSGTVAINSLQFKSTSGTGILDVNGHALSVSTSTLVEGNQGIVKIGDNGAAAGMMTFAGDFTISSSNNGNAALIGNTVSKAIFKSNVNININANSVFSGQNSNVEFDGTGTQTITWNANQNIGFRNVTIGNTNNPTVNLAGNVYGTINDISGNFTVNGSSVVDFKDKFWNSKNASSSFILNEGTTLKLGGGYGGMGSSNFPKNYGTYSLAATSTVQYDNGQVQSVPSPGYGNLIVNTSTQPDGSSANILVQNHFTINSGKTFDLQGKTIYLKGDWINNGILTPNGGTVVLNGTSEQTIGGASTTTFRHLTFDKPSGGITLATNTNVDDKLNLLGGILTTGSNRILVGNSNDLGTITGGSPSSYINGRIERGVVNYNNAHGTNSELFFPVGKGGNYLPVYLNFASLNSSSIVSVEQFESGFHGTAPTGFSTPSRYWQISLSGGSSYSAKVTLNGTGTSLQSTNQILRYSPSTTTTLTTSFTSPEYSSNGLTSMGEFALSEITTSTTTTVSPLTTICANATSGTLTATVSPDPGGGSVQFKIDGTNVGSPVAVSGGGASLTFNPSAYTAGNHNVTAEFNGAGLFSASTSPAVVLTLNGITPGTIAKNAVNPGPACAPLNPDATNLSSGTLATGSGTIAYLWQESTDNGVTWNTAPVTSPEVSNTNSNFNPGPMSVTTRLRRRATSTLSGVECIAYSNELEYVVYPLPVVPSITPSGTLNVCEGSTIQLANATSGGVWSVNNSSNVSVNSTGLVTGISPTPTPPPAISPNISYTVTSINGCVRTVNRAVNVIALPAITSATSVCVGNTFNLTPNTGGTWVSNNPAIASVTATGLVTGIAQGSATFTFTNSAAPGCSQTTPSVAVSAKPAASISSANTSVCAGASTDIIGTVTASGAWTLTLSNGATATGTGNASFTIPVTPVSNTIYSLVALSDAVCDAVTADLTGSTEVNVKPVPGAPSVTVVNNCDGTSTLTASDYTGTLMWSTTETTPGITVSAAGSYSVTQTIDDCVSPQANVTAAPKTAPAPPTISVVDNCNGTSTLTASDYTGTLMWSTTETTPGITVSAAGSYSVTQTIDDCVSPQANVTAAPKTAPAPPTATSPREYCKDEIAPALTATGTSLLWYENAMGGTGNSTAIVPQTATAGSTTFYVTQTIDGCESERTEIEVIVKDDCPPMPVTLSEFRAQKQEQSILLSWKTTSETNSDRFEIERSEDPKNGFTRIATVSSADAESGADYHFLDGNIPPAETIYYRLKMVDRDETFAYSKIQSIKSNLAQLTEIYPNPTSDFINIRTYNWQHVQSVKILDMQGNPVLLFKESHVLSKMDLSKLHPATYLMEINRKNNKTEYRRIIVVR
ncbi:Ig-like domain repeat protein [Dyadobacter sp. 32]|uniref:Ig-like domain repeat protein n=1 Tax=Dyadobacter sp. 32 TaxID=538966 RepID=UPI0011ED37D1